MMKIFNKDKKKTNTKGFGLLETIIIIVITSIISAITTGVILYNTYGSKTGVSYAELANDKALKEFLEVYGSVTSEYYQNINKTEMLEKAIAAMMDYLGDNYTSYLSEEESTFLSESLSGKYKGIGVTLQNKTIIEVFKNSPAEKAGLQPNDVFVKINGKNCSELNDDEIASLIKGQTGEVNLIIDRDKKEMDFKIVLSTLNVPAISYKMLENNIGYIYISTFSNTLLVQVKEALAELESQNMKSLILDVRDNAGGYLNVASDVASVFLEKGKTIYSLQNIDEVKIYKDETEEQKNYPITVIINKNSASASEILAAALKESYGATLLGNVSYGKGKVQQTKSLSDGSMIKYTTAKWLTPNGTCIDGIGLTPDYEVDVEYIYNDNKEIIDIKDNQLENAIKNNK